MSDNPNGWEDLEEVLDEELLKEIEDDIPKGIASEIRNRVENHAPELPDAFAEHSPPPNSFSDKALWLYVGNEIDTRINDLLDFYSKHKAYNNLSETMKEDCQRYIGMYSLREYLS